MKLSNYCYIYYYNYKKSIKAIKEKNYKYLVNVFYIQNNFDLVEFFLDKSKNNIIIYGILFDMIKNNNNYFIDKYVNDKNPILYSLLGNSIENNNIYVFKKILNFELFNNIETELNISNICWLFSLAINNNNFEILDLLINKYKDINRYINLNYVDNTSIETINYLYKNGLNKHIIIEAISFNVNINFDIEILEYIINDLGKYKTHNLIYNSIRTKNNEVVKYIINKKNMIMIIIIF